MPTSGLGCLGILLVTGLLLGAIGLGWVFKGVLIILALLIAVPAIAWFALNWWLQRNVLALPCPVCGYEFSTINNTQCQCPNCGEQLEVKAGKMQRLAPPGVIDVTVVDD